MDIKKLRRLERLAEESMEGLEEYSKLYKKYHEQKKHPKLTKSYGKKIIDRKYSIDHMFLCDSVKKMYFIIDGLFQISRSMNKEFSFFYEGDFMFVLDWGDVRIELFHYIKHNIICLKSTKMTKKEYETIRSFFSEIWDENYTHNLKSKMISKRY